MRREDRFPQWATASIGSTNYQGENAMTKYWAAFVSAAFVSALLLSGTPAVAASWADGFKACDADGSGTISQVEWNSCESKVGDPTMNPTLR